VCPVFDLLVAWVTPRWAVAVILGIELHERPRPHQWRGAASAILSVDSLSTPLTLAA
jgi:hypothetical protein